MVPTVLPGGVVWDFQRERLLLGKEQLALQGVDYERITLTNNQYQDLAGNGFLDHKLIGQTES